MSGLLVTLLLVAAQFATYTYISPTAQSLIGISSLFIGPLLLGYGVAGVIGNFVIGMKSASNVATTMAVISLVLAVLMIAIATVAHNEIAGVLFILGSGTSSHAHLYASAFISGMAYNLVAAAIAAVLIFGLVP